MNRALHALDIRPAQALHFGHLGLSSTRARSARLCSTPCAQCAQPRARSACMRGAMVSRMAERAEGCPSGENAGGTGGGGGAATGAGAAKFAGIRLLGCTCRSR